MSRICFLTVASLFYFTSLFSQVIVEDTMMVFEDIGQREEIGSGKELPLNQKRIYTSKLKFGIRTVKYANNKWGFIDKHETINIPAIYDQISSIDENRIVAEKDKKFGVVNFKNEIIIPFQYSHDFLLGIHRLKKSPDLYKVWLGRKCGVVNFYGQLIVPIEYENIRFLRKNIFKFKQDGKWGILDLNTNLILEPKYNSLKWFDKYSVISKIDRHYNLINRFTGEKLMSTDFDALEIESSKRLYATKDSKMGLITNFEEIIIPFRYDKIISFDSSHQYFKTILNKKVGIYDISQRVELQSPEYQDIKYIENAFVLKVGNKYGISHFVKNELISILPIEYDNIEFLDNLTDIKLTKDGKQGIYSLIHRKIVVPVVFEKIEINSYYDFECFFAYKNEKITILDIFNYNPIFNEQFDNVEIWRRFFVCKTNKKYYLYDIKSYLHQKDFDDIILLNDYFVTIKKNGKWGVYNTHKKEMVIPYEYEEITYNNFQQILHVGHDKYKINENILKKVE